MLNLKSFTRPRTPNTYFVAPEAYSSAAIDRVAPVFTVTPEVLREAFTAIVGKEPRIEWLARDRAALADELIQRSALFRFPDTVSVQFLAAPAGSTLAIYSRSRYGRSDFGVNKARVERWLSALAAAV